MTAVVMHVVDTVQCSRVHREVQLVEERLYPGDLVPDVGAPYRAVSHRCSSGVDCNLIGYPCRWSGINPNHDPFLDK